jgi:tetratricopeptide (TPR) repeat protein
LKKATEAAALADRLAHPFTKEVALEYAAHVHLHRREPEVALAYVLALDKLRAEQRVSFIIEPAFMSAAAQLAQGDFAGVVAGLRETLAPGGLRAIAWQPYGRAIFAEALMRCGDYAEAAASLRQGLDHIEASGERIWEAELHRMNGLVLLAENRIEEASASLRQALAVARAQQAKSLELRAAMDLARLCSEQGRRAEALEALATVYDWFTEGFDTADLKDANALLDALA